MTEVEKPKPKYPNIATSSPHRDWDVISKAGAIGRQLAEAYSEEKTHRVAMVGIFNKQGQILLQKRGARVLWPNVWDISVAGHVEAGQTYIQNAIHEASEEVGIDITKYADTNPLRQVAHYHDDERIDHGVDERFRDKETVSRWNTVYAYQMPDGVETKIDDTGEVEDLQWFDQAEVRRMLAEERDQFRPGGALAIEHLIESVQTGNMPLQPNSAT